MQGSASYVAVVKERFGCSRHLLCPLQLARRSERDGGGLHLVYSLLNLYPDDRWLGYAHWLVFLDH